MRHMLKVYLVTWPSTMKNNEIVTFNSAVLETEQGNLNKELFHLRDNLLHIFTYYKIPLSPHPNLSITQIPGGLEILPLGDKV